MPGFNADAYANAPGSLGVCNIENPTYYYGANTGQNCTTSPNKYASVYNRIYFGMTTEADTSSPVYAYDENIANQPIYWRVLKTVDFSGIPLSI